MKLNFDISQLKNLDFTNIGGWPMPAKIVAVTAVCIAVLAFGFWIDTRPQLAQLNQAHQRETELKTTFEQKNSMVINLKTYKAQMEEMKRSFGTMLRQLPSKTEIEELLTDISQTGLANNLEFELFKPEAETPADFYAELPIKIKVVGGYHSFGKFVSDVSVLPRIVTLNDVIIKQTGKKTDELTMETTAKTYRYLEESAQ